MKSYTFIPDYHDAIASLTDEQYGRVMRAVNEFVFSGKEPQLDGVEYAIWCLAFHRLRVSCSRSHSNAGAPKGSKNNPLGRGARTNQKLIKNKSNVADTQSVTRIISSELVNNGIKETEKKEEIEESSLSSPTPLSIPNLEDKEEKKDKEKKEIYVYKESEDKELTDEEKEDEFFKLMKEHYPRVMAMKQPLTYKQYKKLIDEDGYSSRVIKDILEQMENYAPLNRSYISANLTLRKWLKMRQNG